jgi:hypothetical protein
MSVNVSYTPPTVPHEEWTLNEDSPRSTLDRNGTTATRVFKCAWSGRNQLAAQLRSSYRISVAVTGGSRTFFIGQQYEDTQSYADSIDIAPFGKSGGIGSVASYDSALLTVRYAPRDFNSSQNTTDTAIYYTETFSPAAEFLTLPNTSLKWEDGAALPEDATVSRLIRMTEWSLNFTEAGNVPASLVAYAGYVNSAPVLSRAHGVVYDAETLLYTGPLVRRSFFVDGRRATDLSVTFIHRPTGWNKFFRPGESAPQSVRLGENIYRPYPLVNFVSALGI